FTKNPTARYFTFVFKQPLNMMTRDDLIGKNFGKDDFVFFWSHRDRESQIGKNCLSQWYVRPFIVDGISYNCMEQYLMAEKARLFDDEDVENQIMKESNQTIIKKLGRQVHGYDDAVWSKVRQQISIRGNYEKFSQNEDLKEYLLSTEDKILVEASPKDNIWGIGLDEFSSDATRPENWRGQNILGFALMEAREIIRYKNISVTCGN
ncbi:NADAR family protein, partial [uncultured Muribaculum sp.]|uniref:NADAR family protein n=2 Tax=uncultured Muribaculum sp. TaxID=1918613 RepID=UPI0025D3C7AF